MRSSLNTGPERRSRYSAAGGRFVDHRGFNLRHSEEAHFTRHRMPQNGRGCMTETASAHEAHSDLTEEYVPDRHPEEHTRQNDLKAVPDGTKEKPESPTTDPGEGPQSPPQFILYKSGEEFKETLNNLAFWVNNLLVPVYVTEATSNTCTVSPWHGSHSPDREVNSKVQPNGITLS
jgi:hypothetical protein